MQNNIRIKPLLAVFCDDIRKEDNGKPIIIGVYTSDITIYVPKKERVHKNSDSNLTINLIPALRFGLWVPFLPLGEMGSVAVEFQLVGSTEEFKLNVKAEVHYEEDDDLPKEYELKSFSFAGIPIRFSKDGDLKILFRHIGDQEWETLRTIPVKIKADEETE